MLQLETAAAALLRVRRYGCGAVYAAVAGCGAVPGAQVARWRKRGVEGLTGALVGCCGVGRVKRMCGEGLVSNYFILLGCKNRANWEGTRPQPF